MTGSVVVNGVDFRATFEVDCDRYPEEVTEFWADGFSDEDLAEKVYKSLDEETINRLTKTQDILNGLVNDYFKRHNEHWKPY